MAKTYGINGTPWHVERAHNNNPDDGRRHRSRCVWYDPKAKYCSKQVGDCYGASHCKYYKEGPRDLITTDTATLETVRYERPATSFIPDTARDGTPENQIRVGDMVQKKSGRYMIVDAEMDADRHHVYSCVLAREYESKSAAQDLIHIYSNWYLTDREPVRSNAYEFWIVQHLPPTVAGHVKSERALREARKKIDAPKRVAVRMTSMQTDDYVLSSYAGKFSRPDGVKVEQMYLIVRILSKEKKLPVKVDNVHRVIYIEDVLYKKYWEKIKDQKRFELSV